MNVESYITLSDRLIDLERMHALSSRISNLIDALNRLASSPAEPTFQTQVSDALSELEVNNEAALSQLTPAELTQIQELGGADFYSRQTISEFRSQLGLNAATPASTAQFVASYFERRTEFIRQLGLAKDSLRFFGFDSGPQIEKMEAQIGFTFPREMFDNELSGLIGELQFASRLIHFVAEATGNEDETVEVGQISTSDPLFWFVMSVVLGKAVGSCVSWALEQWKTVEAIRQARALTEQTQVYTAIEISKFFDDKIKTDLDQSVEEKAVDILSSYQGTPERRNEIANGLKHWLKQLLARIERGLTVEVKLLEPPIGEGEVDPVAHANTETVREEFKYLAQCLIFPAPSKNPVLQIAAEPPTSTNHVDDSGAKKDKK